MCARLVRVASADADRAGGPDEGVESLQFGASGPVARTAESSEKRLVAAFRPQRGRYGAGPTRVDGTGVSHAIHPHVGSRRRDEWALASTTP